MPPRRSARVAEAAERQPCALAPLPLALVLFIFSLVPVDQRLRCLEVCKGWYATLSERSLWMRLDISATAGLVPRATDALLRAAEARAAGQLQALDLTDCVGITHEALLAVVRANADTLTELRMEGSCGLRYNGSFTVVSDIEAVLDAAPRLLAEDVHCDGVAEAHRLRKLLRNEGPLTVTTDVVRVRKLHVRGVNDEAGVLALAADLPAHTWLKEVHVHGAPLRTLAALDAVADALALRLPSLTLADCHMTPASVPALARIINGGALTELCVWNGMQELLDQPAATLIADALRANSALTSLKLLACSFWEDAAGAVLILGALTAHRSLRTLDLDMNATQAGEQHAPALGAALGALVAANSPALHDLRLSSIAVDEAGLLALGVLLDALPLNTHLRTLNLYHDGWTNEFARDRLLPAVRANTSLQHLIIVPHHHFDDNNGEFLHEAKALVAARNAAAAP
jgi:hypothetical protein